MKKYDRWVIAMILLGFVMAGIFLTVAPERIPAHYNLSGEVDRWGSKYESLIMPAISLLFGLFMGLFARYEGKMGRVMNEKIVSVVNILVLLMFNLIWMFFMWKAVDPDNLGSDLGELGPRLIMVLVTGAFIPLGNIMPKVQRNAAFGLRTKWSMADDWCWQQSQRIGGYIMATTGILGVILSAILPLDLCGVVLAVLMIFMIVSCTWASYRIYMRRQVQ